jgi:glycosyltransferase involved in cell wall biosynthesis
MRILFVRTAEKISGAEIVNINLLREFSKKSSLKFTFLTNLQELSDRIADLGIPSGRIRFFLPEIGTKRQLLQALFSLPVFIGVYIYEIHRLEKGKKFHVICLQSMTEKIFLTVPLRLLNYQVVWYDHGPVFASRASQIIKRAYRLLSNYVTVIITVSYDTRRDLAAGGIPLDKIETNHNGIDTTHFKPLTRDRIRLMRKVMNVPTKAKIVGFLGTITFEKGIDEFILLSKRLLKRSNKYCFLIIGDGPALLWCRRRVKDLKVSHKYIFTGYQQDVRNYLGIMDIFYFPTRHHEGISLAILEAFSMGKIVLTRNIGGNREIIRNNYNGYIYKNMNIHAMSRIISDLNKNPALRRRISNNARNTVLREYNITYQAKRLGKIFFQLS